MEQTRAYEWRIRALAPPIDDARLRVRLLAAAASVAPLLGEDAAGVGFAADAVEVAEEAADPYLLAIALELKAFTLPYADARLLLLRVIDTMRELGERDHEVRASINLGALALAAFSWEDAATYSEHALGLVRETGNRDGVATTSINLAQALLQLRDEPRAVELAQEVRQLEVELGARDLEPVCAYIDTVVAARRGDQASAVAAFVTGEEALAELGIHLEEAEAELRRQAAAAVG